MGFSNDLSAVSGTNYLDKKLVLVWLPGTETSSHPILKRCSSKLFVVEPGHGTECRFEFPANFKFGASNLGLLIMRHVNIIYDNI